jgi:hypothetical protein
MSGCLLMPGGSGSSFPESVLGTHNGWPWTQVDQSAGSYAILRPGAGQRQDQACEGEGRKPYTRSGFSEPRSWLRRMCWEAG